MASSPDAMRACIEAYPWPPQRGGVEVARQQGLHPLQPAHRRTGCPAASNPSGRPGAGAVVATRSLGQPRSFGREVMPLDEALEFIATEGFFWIHTS